MSYSTGVCSKTAANVSQIKDTLKLVQLTEYEDNINIVSRTNRAIPELSEEMEEIVKEVGLNIYVEKTKQLYKTGKEDEKCNVDN